MAAFSRRDFARLLALSGSAALVPSTLRARGSDPREAFDVTIAPLPQTPLKPLNAAKPTQSVSGVAAGD